MSKRGFIEAGQTMFSFVGAQMLDLGDGVFKYVPGKPVAELTVKQAAARLGVNERTVRRLVEAGTLAARRPARFKIWIPADALEKYYAATCDPEYWTGKK